MPTPQHPIETGFDASSTTSDVIRGLDLSGRRVIVTGGHSGLGLEISRTLAEAGASVVVAARTPRKARRNLAHLPAIEIAPLDLVDPASIGAFASEYLERNGSLDLLINCAGIMAAPLDRDRRGIESQFATNHLGHFSLTIALWQALERAGQARIVSVSSRGHQISDVDFDDLNFERRPYDRWIAYGQSKTANALFARALDRRGQARNIRAFSAHPGSILTDLMRHLSDEDLKGFGIERSASGAKASEAFFATFPDAKTLEQGAATPLWSAVSPALDGLGGVYCEDCSIAPLAPEGSRRVPGVLAYAVDEDAAERLWETSERMTGQRLPA